ncbi:MAG: cytochrome c [Opitutaceae bacterium]
MSDSRSENAASRRAPDNSDRAVADSQLQTVHAQLMREKPEPQEGFSPIPIFLLFVFSGLIFFGGVYMAEFSGGFNALAFNETVHMGRGESAEPPPPPDPVAMGKRLFTQNCVACHQVTGLGLPPVFPPLAGSEWVLGSEQRTIRILLNGLSGELVVEGNTYNGVMPAFGPSSVNWSDDQIASVLTYIRQEWGNDAPPVLPATVAEVRAATAGRTTSWTQAELEPLGQ